jgi:hypothetical protein
MSTTKKTRTVKPKATKEVTAAPAPVPVVAAPVVPAPVAAPAPVQAAPAPKVVKPRPIIFTSTSRVKTGINANGINAAVSKLSDPLDEKVKAYKNAKASLESGQKTDTREVEKTVDGVVTKSTETYTRPITAAETVELKKIVDEHNAHITTMERDLHAYNQVSVRFAKHTADVLAVTCDKITEEIITVTMTSAIADKHKNIGLNEMYNADLESSPLAPLFKTLPSYVSTRDARANAKRESAEKARLTVELKEQEKAMKKRYKITKKQVEATKPADAPVTAEPAAAAPAEEAAANAQPAGASLSSYVKNIGKWVAQSRFDGIKVRFSGDMCDHIALLLKEFLQRLCPLLGRAVRFDDVKTVKVATVKYVLETLLIDGHAANETIELVNVDVPNPEILKAEEVKKAAEKAAGRKYTIDLDKIPKSIGREAKQVITFPTSGFPALEASIDKALSDLDAEDKATAAAKLITATN